MASSVTLVMKGDGAGRFTSDCGRVFYCAELRALATIEIQAKEYVSAQDRAALRTLEEFIVARDKTPGIAPVKSTARNVLATLKRDLGIV